MKVEELNNVFPKFSSAIFSRTACVGEFLYDTIVSNDFKNVLEIGTNRGCNSAYMTAACDETGGKFFGIEIDNNIMGGANNLLQECGLSNYELINDQSLPILAHIMNQNLIDMVFIDGAHSFKHSFSEFAVADRLINKDNGLILFHDTHYVHGEAKGDGGVPLTAKKVGATLIKTKIGKADWQTREEHLGYVKYGEASVPEQWLVKE
jgi:predicted O-methyltransferase YrrM